MNGWLWFALYLLVAIPAMLALGRLLRRRSAECEPAEPSIFDNTIPPGAAPLTAERVREAARRLRAVPPEDEAPLWGRPVIDDDPGRE